MPVVLSCVNLKGGVGKTALAVNFAAYCGSKGLKTLLIDLDPQTNATFSSIGVEEWEKHARKRGTVADLLGVKGHTSAEGVAKTVKQVIRKRVFPKVHLIPSHLDLFTVDLDLGSASARETKLRRALGTTLQNYEMVVCDCPPNLTIPTQNALAISTHFVIPISPDFLSAIGVALLLSRVERLAEELENPLTLAGIVMSRVGRRARHREDTQETIRAKFGDKVLTQNLTERACVAEACEDHKPVFAMRDADATREFTNVSKELLERVGLQT